jgi:hypothetical protein
LLYTLIRSNKGDRVFTRNGSAFVCCGKVLMMHMTLQTPATIHLLCRNLLLLSLLFLIKRDARLKLVGTHASTFFPQILFHTSSTSCAYNPRLLVAAGHLIVGCAAHSHWPVALDNRSSECSGIFLVVFMMLVNVEAVHR